MKSFVLLATALVLGTSTMAQADHSAHAAPAASAAAATWVDGEVRKVDTELGRLTLRHGPIPNLGMGNMTMVFRVADPKLLDGLKVGDALRFQASRVGGAITVTAIEAKR
ncbi:MAG: copper-binding protein [Proteobacteria bacterium]|nr:copper-binding protein [Pseudomonadota bacterium]